MENRMPQHRHSKQDLRFVFFIPNDIQGFIFPSQKMLHEATNTLQRYLTFIHHLQNIIAYAYEMDIAFLFILRTSLRNTLHTS